MVAKSIAKAGAALALLGPIPAWAQSDSLIALSDSDVATTNQAMTAGSWPHGKQGSEAVRSSKPLITAPLTAEFTELLVSYSDRKSRTRLEFGALGGGRSDAPGLVHVGLGMNF